MIYTRACWIWVLTVIGLDNLVSKAKWVYTNHNHSGRHEHSSVRTWAIWSITMILTLTRLIGLGDHRSGRQQCNDQKVSIVAERRNESTMDSDGRHDRTRVIKFALGIASLSRISILAHVAMWAPLRSTTFNCPRSGTGLSWTRSWRIIRAFLAVANTSRVHMAMGWWYWGRRFEKWKHQMSHLKMALLQSPCDHLSRCQTWLVQREQPGHASQWEQTIGANIPRSDQRTSLPINTQWQLWIESNKFKQCNNSPTSNNRVIHMAPYSKHLTMAAATVVTHATV